MAVRFRPLVALVLLLSTIAAVFGTAGSPTSYAAPPKKHAAIVVDTGQGVVTKCVGFTESSITGLEALQRAPGINPKTYGFSGNGAAVCNLCGVGCKANSSCLTCGGSNYWAYFRSTGGGGFHYSGGGAGMTTVRDGDVEGWRWGSGSAPPYRSFNSVCAATIAADNAASGGSSSNSQTQVKDQSTTKQSTSGSTPNKQTTSAQAKNDEATTTTDKDSTGSTSTKNTAEARALNEVPANYTTWERFKRALPVWTMLFIALCSLGFVFAKTRMKNSTD